PSGRAVWDTEPARSFSVPDAAMQGHGPLFVQSGMMRAPPAIGPQFPSPPESRADAAFRTSLERWGVLGDLGRKFLFGDPNATVRIPINEYTGLPATVRDYHDIYGHLPWYERPTHPDIEDATKLALLAMGGGIGFARRGAVGMPGGFIKPTGIRKLTTEEAKGMRELFPGGPEGARAVLDKLARGEHVSVPRSVTRDTLETYVLRAQK